MRSRALRLLKFYLPALIWMGVVFYFSSIPNLKYTDKVTPEIILRKSAHLIEYIVLVYLVWRIFHDYHKLNWRKAYLLSFLIASLYAFSDEYHQTFIPGRSGRVFDAIYDMVSIFAGLQIIQLFRLKKYKKEIIFTIIFSLIILTLMDYKMIKEGETEKNKTRSVYEEISASENDQGLDPSGIHGENTEQKNSNLTDIDQAKPIEKEAEEIPKKIFIKVPFTSQAPLSNWDALHEEACEETSLIMVKHYLDRTPLNKNIAEKEIQSIVGFEKKTYGEWKDSNTEEIVKLAKDYYNLNNLEVIYDFEAEDLKIYLAKERPVIVPAAGRLLENPNFTPPGPLYHNLVLVGYDGNTIITNDPGTRKGEGYKYNINTLYRAIHDFPGEKENIEQGRKAMIVIE